MSFVQNLKEQWGGKVPNKPIESERLICRAAEPVLHWQR